MSTIVAYLNWYGRVSFSQNDWNSLVNFLMMRWPPDLNTFVGMELLSWTFAWFFWQPHPQREECQGLNWWPLGEGVWLLHHLWMTVSPACCWSVEPISQEFCFCQWWMYNHLHWVWTSCLLLVIHNLESTRSTSYHVCQHSFGSHHPYCWTRCLV